MQLRSRSLIALFSCLVALLAILLPAAASAQVYIGQPKLIVIVVIDQFRGDYLNRDRAEFKGRGFNLFMKEGAWFTDCYFDYANTKTAPGHATIGTGAYTDGHGIESNDWWDAARSYDAKVTSVQDERYQLVDLPHDSIPANLPGAPAWAAKLGNRRFAAQSSRHHAGRRVAPGHQWPLARLRHLAQGPRGHPARWSGRQWRLLDR